MPAEEPGAGQHDEQRQLRQRIGEDRREIRCRALDEDGYRDQDAAQFEELQHFGIGHAPRLFRRNDRDLFLQHCRFGRRCIILREIDAETVAAQRLDIVRAAALVALARKLREIAADVPIGADAPSDPFGRSDGRDALAREDPRRLSPVDGSKHMIEQRQIVAPAALIREMQRFARHLGRGQLRHVGRRRGDRARQRPADRVEERLPLVRRGNLPLEQDAPEPPGEQFPLLHLRNAPLDQFQPETVLRQHRHDAPDIGRIVGRDIRKIGQLATLALRDKAHLETDMLGNVQRIGIAVQPDALDRLARPAAQVRRRRALSQVVQNVFELLRAACLFARVGASFERDETRRCLHSHAQDVLVRIALQDAHDVRAEQFAADRFRHRFRVREQHGAHLRVLVDPQPREQGLCFLARYLRQMACKRLPHGAAAIVRQVFQIFREFRIRADRLCQEPGEVAADEHGVILSRWRIAVRGRGQPLFEDRRERTRRHDFQHGEGLALRPAILARIERHAPRIAYGDVHPEAARQGPGAGADLLQRRKARPANPGIAAPAATIDQQSGQLHRQQFVIAVHFSATQSLAGKLAQPFEGVGDRALRFACAAAIAFHDRVIVEIVGKRLAVAGELLLIGPKPLREIENRRMLRRIVEGAGIACIEQRSGIVEIGQILHPRPDEGEDRLHVIDEIALCGEFLGRGRELLDRSVDIGIGPAQARRQTLLESSDDAARRGKQHVRWRHAIRHCTKCRRMSSFSSSARRAARLISTCTKPVKPISRKASPCTLPSPPSSAASRG